MVDDGDEEEANDDERTSKRSTNSEHESQFSKSQFTLDYCHEKESETLTGDAVQPVAAVFNESDIPPKSVFKYIKDVPIDGEQGLNRGPVVPVGQYQQKAYESLYPMLLSSHSNSEAIYLSTAGHYIRDSTLTAMDSSQQQRTLAHLGLTNVDLPKYRGKYNEVMYESPQATLQNRHGYQQFIHESYDYFAHPKRSCIHQAVYDEQRSFNLQQYSTDICDPRTDRSHDIGGNTNDKQQKSMGSHTNNSRNFTISAILGHSDECNSKDPDSKSIEKGPGHNDTNHQNNQNNEL